MDRKKPQSRRSAKVSEMNVKGAAGSTAEGRKNDALWVHNPQIQYRLSDPTFVELTWTLLPSRINFVRNITTYKAVSSKPHMAFFKPRGQVQRIQYANGALMAVCQTDATGSVYYPDGRLAMRHQHAGRCSRLIVKWPGNKDTRTGRLRTPGVCAIFDSLGNGVVYDEDGKIRLVFNQQGGVNLDTANGLPAKWSWLINNSHLQSLGASCNEDELSSSQYLATSVVNTNDVAHASDEKVTKDDKRKSRDHSALIKSKLIGDSLLTADKTKDDRRKSRDHSALIKSKLMGDSLLTSDKVNDVKLKQNTVIHLDDRLHESESPTLQKSPEESSSTVIKQNTHDTDIETVLECLKVFKNHCLKGKSSSIKPIVVKLNSFMTLRIVDQATVSLTFSAQKQSLRLELGVIVDTRTQMRVDKMDASKVAPDHVVNFFEQFPRASLTKILHTVDKQRARGHLNEACRTIKR